MAGLTCMQTDGHPDGQTNLPKDCALISTVYKCMVTSRVHKNVFKFFMSAEIFGVASDHRSVYSFFKFLKSGLPPPLERPKTPPKDPDF